MLTTETIKLKKIPLQRRFILTYKSGPLSGKVLEFVVGSIDEAIETVKGLYNHVRETGIVTKKTDTKAVIKATAPDTENPGKVHKFTYTIQEKSRYSGKYQ